ncbi:hypothetical protein SPBR_01883 [Sporothrix brasiliensis 5110]|uniref:Aminoglycoside phosphotransferase domain-containing protein n=1 Tax=Sporothrix brasiliensis 5110 TaxID=1398154 RepID=A0A0C2FIS3_9PEZI|nr:uncharacterized protein SPBR_01883 [Sporothrix brasiliensis 5110]KIH91023.1 hypothetical protein SPBR_01883 [Sporothrix brasiliensis 5110]
MPEITSDSDLPKLVNTAAKRAKWAKKLAVSCLQSAAKRLDNPPMQGMFSRTLFATLADKSEVVIQFRTEVLDLSAFQVAREILGGALVPWVRTLEDPELEGEGVWAYALDRMPGTIWLRGVAGKGAEARIAVNRSLGQAFSRGFVAGGSSADAIAKHVRPHLEAIVASPLEEIDPYRALCKEYLDEKLGILEQLPLWIAHYDLNDVNVLIDAETFEVTALIDWELSHPLPLGIGFGRVHTLAGEYTGGEFWMPPEFETAETAFWGTLIAGIPDVAVKTQVAAQMALVQDAVLLGTLLSTFYFEDGKVGAAQVPLKALPKFLTYRIPPLRGNEPPYSV